MNEKDSLEAAERHITDALDAIDTLDDQSTSTVVGAALLTGARICVDARLAEVDERGDKGRPAPDE